MEIQEIQKHMNRLVDQSPLNKVVGEDIRLEEIFCYPLLGVAEASDPLFSKLKEPEVVGKHHLSPAEWMPEAKTVISYFLPFAPLIREANRIPGQPAREWLYGRIEGEEFNNEMHRGLVDIITEAGGKAAAPLLDARHKVVKLRSNWSQRHAAYIAGLGTFSLSKSLITEKGCAGRYGSIVTSLKMAPTSPVYNELDDYCNQCGECIERCPSGAITQEGKDVQVCYQYLQNEIKPRFKPRYGCGKCQAGVACEHTIP